jgi:hypothetical protein
MKVRHTTQKALAKYMMKREAGERNFPIWLIGDSNPVHWQSYLEMPLDPRHPVRHNIWTPVLDVIQDKVFRAGKLRVDTSALYIRNAVDNPEKKPSQTDKKWKQVTENEILELKTLIEKHRPIIVICFGAFAFEFTRRALGEKNIKNYGYWGARRLGIEFRRRIGDFRPDSINILPLLHRSIAGGKFMQSHDYFCDKSGGNYFEMAGGDIADKLVKYKDQLHIWIE